MGAQPINEAPDSTSPRPPSSAGSQELDRDACLSLLGSANVGRIAVTMPNGAPVIRPVNYLFDRPTQSVLFRTAAGSKFHALVRARRAAFEVDGTDAVTRAGWSVIARGVAEAVTDPGELSRFNRLELDSWAPGEKPHWVRIRAVTVSGRCVQAAAARTQNDPPT